MRLLLPLLLASAGLAAPAVAETAQFDLAGPTLRVRVTHAGVTLPIAQVPQLAAGDRISVVADLPGDQSAHYLLIAAFLRGSTNPPPDAWFARAETWTKKGRRGLSLTVPSGAQQVVLFLAPATGGDFPTLRNAVQGRPGAFVRAAQELAQASLDHSRLAAYLAAVRKPAPDDPGRLDRITPLLARSLQVKINSDCLAKLPDLQAPCLLQNQESLVLDDGHSNAITDAVGGPGADLALQLSATPQGGLGYYSPYIAAIRDVIGILGSIRTAKYQYIPALAALDGDRMALVLNVPPSFHNPKSVLVAPLPVVSPVQVPPLRIATPAPALCGGSGDLLLPITGAPLIYATDYAHDLVLRLRWGDGPTITLPATPDVERGGLVVPLAGRLPADPKGPLTATLHGVWGFQPFDGPTLTLPVARPGQWRLSGDAAAGGTVAIAGGVAVCVTGVTVQPGDGPAQPAAWKADGATGILVTLPKGVSRAETTGIAIANPADATPDRLTLPAAAAPKGIGATRIAQSVQRPPATTTPTIVPGSDADIPADATLAFSLRADDGARFTAKDLVEIATDAGAATTLSAANGLRLADRQVLVATIRLGEALGASAFGPVHARIVRDGIAGGWVPLGTLVRLPVLHRIDCPSDPAVDCTLSGDALFLIAALSATPGFEHPIAVPDGFTGATLPVPHPSDHGLFVRLRDDPATIARITG